MFTIHNRFFLFFLAVAATSTLVRGLPPPAPARQPFIRPSSHPPPSENLTLLSTETHCRTREASWRSQGTSMVFSHCTSALARFWQTQVTPTRLEGDFEFLSHTARPIWKPVNQVAVTPRKYEVGSCVLTIAMLNFYPPGVLGEEEGTLEPLYDNDIATFFKAWNAMHDLMFACKGPGWMRIGDVSESIGIFVWSKFSAMDRRTPSGTISGLAINSSSVSIN